MSFSYTVGTDIHKVRALIPDTRASNYTFEDEELQVFLDLWSSDPLLAAAQACETLAADAARIAVAYSIAGYGFSMDRTRVPEWLLKRAKALRDAATAGTPYEFESVTEWSVDSSGRDLTNYIDTPPVGE